jgi:hypothetical protein
MLQARRHTIDGQPQGPERSRIEGLGGWRLPKEQTEARIMCQCRAHMSCCCTHPPCISSIIPTIPIDPAKSNNTIPLADLYCLHAPSAHSSPTSPRTAVNTVHASIQLPNTGPKSIFADSTCCQTPTCYFQISCKRNIWRLPFNTLHLHGARVTQTTT